MPWEDQTRTCSMYQSLPLCFRIGLHCYNQVALASFGWLFLVDAVALNTTVHHLFLIFIRFYWNREKVLLLSAFIHPSLLGPQWRPLFPFVFYFCSLIYLPIYPRDLRIEYINIRLDIRSANDNSASDYKNRNRIDYSRH